MSCFSHLLSGRHYNWILFSSLTRVVQFGLVIKMSFSSKWLVVVVCVFFTILCCMMTHSSCNLEFNSGKTNIFSVDGVLDYEKADNRWKEYSKVSAHCSTAVSWHFSLFLRSQWSPPDQTWELSWRSRCHFSGRRPFYHPHHSQQEGHLSPGHAAAYPHVYGLWLHGQTGEHQTVVTNTSISKIPLCHAPIQIYCTRLYATWNWRLQSEGGLSFLVILDKRTAVQVPDTVLYGP